MFRLLLLVLMALDVAEVSAADLLTVYQQALESDPSLKNAALKVEMGGAQKKQAIGEMLPQVTANANWSENEQKSIGLSGSATSNYPGTRYTVSVSQPLIDFAKFWNWRRATEVEHQYESENLEAQHALLQNVVERYFEVLAAEDQLSLFQKELSATGTRLEQIKTLFDRQLVEITELYDVEARLDQLSASVIEAETLLNKAKESLKELTNQTPDGLFRLREDLEFSVLDGSLEDWIAVAKSENPMLAAQLSAIAAADDEVDMQKSRHLPVVDLQFNYFDSDTGFQSSRTPKTQVQVAAINLTVPIFNGGVTLQRTYEAQHRLAMVKNENEAKVRALIKETSDAFLSSNAGVKRITASQRALLSAQKSLEAKEKSFRYGLETISEVLDAQQTEFKTKRELSLAKYNFIKNRVRFLRAIGLISIENLQEINGWLLPV
ncbi:MAG: type I secretion protein TolC [Methylomonas sp.]|nr:MAG: type I secretion protein TolC [Methylomonas sp.]